MDNVAPLRRVITVEPPPPWELYAWVALSIVSLASLLLLPAVL